MKSTGKMQKILEKFMKKYWKNAKKTGKVREICQSKKWEPCINYWSNWVVELVELGGNPLR